MIHIRRSFLPLPLACTMADAQDDVLRQIFASCQVQDTFSDAILEQGWTIDHFAMMDFENDLSDVLGSSFGALVPFQKAALKLAWSKCQQHQQAPQPTPMSPASASSETRHHVLGQNLLLLN